MRAANSHWESPEEKARVEEAARKFPIQSGEGPTHYFRRLAVEAGLITDGEGIRRWPAREAARTVAEVREDLRLPYKEPREPGEDG